MAAKLPLETYKSNGRRRIPQVAIAQTIAVQLVADYPTQQFVVDKVREHVLKVWRSRDVVAKPKGARVIHTDHTTWILMKLTKAKKYATSGEKRVQIVADAKKIAADLRLEFLDEVRTDEQLLETVLTVWRNKDAISTLHVAPKISFAQAPSSSSSSSNGHNSSSSSNSSPHAAISGTEVTLTKPGPYRYKNFTLRRT